MMHKLLFGVLGVLWGKIGVYRVANYGQTVMLKSLLCSFCLIKRRKRTAYVYQLDSVKSKRS